MVNLDLCSRSMKKLFENDAILFILIMKNIFSTKVLTIISTFLFLTYTASSEENIGTAEKIIGTVYKNRPADIINAGDDLFYNQFIKTMDDSAATIKFDDGTALHIGPNSQIQLDDLVYNKKSSVLTGYLDLSKGIFQFANNHKTKMYVTLKTPAATIGIRGTKFAAYAKNSYSELAVTEGNINSTTKFGTYNLDTGEALKVTSSSLTKSNSISKEMKEQFDRASSLLKLDAGLEIFEVIDAGQAANPLSQCAKKSSSWLNDAALREQIKRIDITRLFFLKTKYGIIVIQAINFPPLVNKVRRLIKEEYYKRSPFFNVRLGMMAEAGDFFNNKPRKSLNRVRKVILKPVHFKRGSVASGYPNDEKLGDGRSFFIALREMKLNKSDYKVWGRVIYGMSVADKLEVGSPPAEPDFIIDMKTGSQIREKCL
ncbi:MAG: hypothetical protein CFH10_01480 [Alphaproteobacteria bacterium MarineAlpha4_Bin2]|nr:MAG: hypothetical protein CFH10_01480 [Alphaproteobacteria bacterium MarineAlpha4_Bin2]